MIHSRPKRLDANNVAQALWQLRITDVQPPVTAPAL